MLRLWAFWGRRTAATGGWLPPGGRFHGGCAPHSLFVLDKKRTGRARSKRKNAAAGRSAQSAYLHAAGEGWLAVPRGILHETRCPWGNHWPGVDPDTRSSFFRWR